MQITRFASAAMLAGVFAAGPHAAAPAALIVRPAELQWESVKGYPPGYQRATLEGRADRHVPVTYRVRLPPHFRFQPHTHEWSEHVTVLSGAWSLGFGRRFDESRMEALGPGSFVVIPGGVPHYVMTRDEETIIQVHRIGPSGLTFVPDSGPDPR